MMVMMMILIPSFVSGHSTFGVQRLVFHVCLPPDSGSPGMPVPSYLDAYMRSRIGVLFRACGFWEFFFLKVSDLNALKSADQKCKCVLVAQQGKNSGSFG